jgi:hypothetical protein
MSQVCNWESDFCSAEDSGGMFVRSTRIVLPVTRVNRGAQIVRF